MSRADRLGAGEVHRRALDRLELAQRDQRVVDRQVAVGVERQLVVEHVARAGAGQVPVGVVGQVDDRRLVGRGRVLDLAVRCRRSGCR